MIAQPETEAETEVENRSLVKHLHGPLVGRVRRLGEEFGVLPVRTRYRIRMQGRAGKGDEKERERGEGKQKEAWIKVRSSQFSSKTSAFLPALGFRTSVRTHAHTHLLSNRRRVPFWVVSAHTAVDGDDRDMDSCAWRTLLVRARWKGGGEGGRNEGGQ